MFWRSLIVMAELDAFGIVVDTHEPGGNMMGGKCLLKEGSGAAAFFTGEEGILLQFLSCAFRCRSGASIKTSSSSKKGISWRYSDWILQFQSQMILCSQ